MPLGLQAGPAMPGPALPGQADRGGKEARGKVVAGLGLELLRISIPLLGNSEDGQALAEVVAKLGKRFVKPASDMGQAEMKFMGSQLYPAPQGQAMQVPQALQQQFGAMGIPPGGPKPGVGPPPPTVTPASPMP